VTLFTLKGTTLSVPYLLKEHDLDQIAGCPLHRSANRFHNFEGSGSGFLALAHSAFTDSCANFSTWVGSPLDDSSGTYT
jgi:hypothetical protein